MHTIEPYWGWLKFYNSTEDEQSPFFGVEHSEFEFTDNIYGYCIHPQWDFIGSETLYIKILFIDYQQGVAIIEFIGEWNDALHNDIMYLKRNIVDELVAIGVNKFILIGESVFNFHGSDDCYYEEWFEDVEDGWIAAIGFQEHIKEEWRNFNVDNYLNFGGELEVEDWRTLKPLMLFSKVNESIIHRIGL